MRIAEIHIYQVDLPVHGAPYTMAGTSLSKMDTTLVKLVTDTGVIGWGETCPLGATYAPAHAPGARTALAQMAPHLIGTAAAPRPAYMRMDAVLAGHAYAKAAIDIAVHDALARALNVPVATVLGGALRDQVPSYYAIGLETPQDAARIAAEKFGEGYKRLQLKAGGRAPEIDIATIRKVSEVTQPSGVRLVVDANRGWRVADTIMISEACRGIPLIIEQPCDRLAEIQVLRGRLCHPLYLDENADSIDAVSQILGKGLADGFGLKLTRAGGLGPMATLRDMLASQNLPHTCDDSWGGDLVAAACLHLAATTLPRQLDGVWIAAPYIGNRYDRENSPGIQDGTIALPPGPGLGITPDEANLGPPEVSVT